MFEVRRGVTCILDFALGVECKRNVMAHAQKPDLVFQRNGRVHLYRRGCQFSRVLAFWECGSAENDCSNTGLTVPSETEDCLATHSIRLFPLHFSSLASPCATRFRFHSTKLSASSWSLYLDGKTSLVVLQWEGSGWGWRDRKLKCASQECRPLYRKQTLSNINSEAHPEIKIRPFDCCWVSESWNMQLY